MTHDTFSLKPAVDEVSFVLVKRAVEENTVAIEFPSTKSALIPVTISVVVNAFSFRLILFPFANIPVTIEVVERPLTLPELPEHLSDIPALAIFLFYQAVGSTVFVQEVQEGS